MFSRIVKLVAALAVATCTMAAPASAAEFASPFQVPITGENTMGYTYLYVNPADSCATGSTGAAGFRAQDNSNYETYTLTVSQTDTYEYVDVGGGSDPVDIIVAVYPLGGFNPESPSTNCLHASDDRSVPTWSLSAGSYTILIGTYIPNWTGVTNFTIIGDEGGVATLTDSVPGSSSTKDLTIWQQAYGLSSDSSTCESGWSPSWMQWPNQGQGGFVCERRIYVYDPDAQVTS